MVSCIHALKRLYVVPPSIQSKSSSSPASTIHLNVPQLNDTVIDTPKKKIVERSLSVKSSLSTKKTVKPIIIQCPGEGYYVSCLHYPWYFTTVRHSGNLLEEANTVLFIRKLLILGNSRVDILVGRCTTHQVLFTLSSE